MQKGYPGDARCDIFGGLIALQRSSRAAEALLGQNKMTLLGCAYPCHCICLGILCVAGGVAGALFA